MDSRPGVGLVMPRDFCTCWSQAVLLHDSKLMLILLTVLPNVIATERFG